MITTKSKKPKNVKIIDVIASAYKGPLNTPRMVDLTFEDLKTLNSEDVKIVNGQLEKMKKYAKKNGELKAWDRMSCAACFPKWH